MRFIPLTVFTVWFGVIHSVSLSPQTPGFHFRPVSGNLGGPSVTEWFFSVSTSSPVQQQSRILASPPCTYILSGVYKSRAPGHRVV